VEKEGIIVVIIILNAKKSVLRIFYFMAINKLQKKFFIYRNPECKYPEYFFKKTNNNILTEMKGHNGKIRKND